MSETEQLVAFAAAILGRAAAQISTGYRSLVDGFGRDAELGRVVREQGLAAALASDAVTHKGPNREVVTEADRRAELLLREAVAARYPDHSFTGEEWGSVERGPVRWVVDPIDGTSAMIRWALAQAWGLELTPPTPAFGVMIGILDGDRPLAGVVGRLRPGGDGLVLADTWVGAAGQPSRVNGAPVDALTVRSLDAATVACTVPEVMFARQPGLWQAIAGRAVAIERDQNCVGYARLLGGGIDIVIERDLGIYDVAALVPILTGAGILVTDHAGQPLRFDAASRDGEYLAVAAAPALHAEVLELLRTAADESDDDGTTFAEGYARKF